MWDFRTVQSSPARPLIPPTRRISAIRPRVSGVPALPPSFAPGSACLKSLPPGGLRSAPVVLPHRRHLSICKSSSPRRLSTSSPQATYLFRHLRPAGASLLTPASAVGVRRFRIRLPPDETTVGTRTRLPRPTDDGLLQSLRAWLQQLARPHFSGQLRAVPAALRRPHPCAQLRTWLQQLQRPHWRQLRARLRQHRRPLAAGFAPSGDNRARQASATPGDPDRSPRRYAVAHRSATAPGLGKRRRRLQSSGRCLCSSRSIVLARGPDSSCGTARTLNGA